MASDQYLTPRQLEQRGIICASTSAKQRMQGDGPPYSKVGRRVLYRWSDVEKWLAEHRRSSTSDPGPQKSRQPAEARS